MSCTDVEAIFQLYQEQIYKQTAEHNQEQPLTSNELALFIYFVSFLRTTPTFHTQIKEYKQKYEQIINQAIQIIDKIEAPQLNALIWSLGIYNFETRDLHLIYPQKFLLVSKTQQLYQSFNAEQLPSVAFGLKNIMDPNSKQDKELLNPLIIDIAKYIEKNLSQVPPTLLITFVHALPENTITLSASLFKHLTECFQDDQLPLSDYLKAIQEFIRISNYENSERLKEYIQITQEFIENKGYGDVEQSLILGIIEQLSHVRNAVGQFNEIIPLLLKAIHSKSDKLNITEYLQLFVLLPRIKMYLGESININKTIQILKDLLYKSSVFVQSDFEYSEIVTVLIASAALRLDDKKFIGSWVGLLHENIEKLELEDLLKLAMGFVVYVRQFEDFYLRVHGICCVRRSQFSQDQTFKLRKVFDRIRILVPDSPFLK